MEFWFYYLVSKSWVLEHPITQYSPICKAIHLSWNKGLRAKECFFFIKSSKVSKVYMFSQNSTAGISHCSIRLKLIVCQKIAHARQPINIGPILRRGGAASIWRLNICVQKEIFDTSASTLLSSMLCCSKSWASFSSSLPGSSSSSLLSSLLLLAQSSFPETSGLNFVTASFAVLLKLAIFDSSKDLQTEQTLMSGRLHSRWNECPHPRKIRHNGLSHLHSFLSHLLLIQGKLLILF